MHSTLRRSILSISLLCSLNLNAGFYESSGDALLLAIPLASYGYSYYQDDRDGQIELTKSLLSTLAVTYVLKYSIDEERPNKKDNHSFPSGHTSLTFASASYLHQRYGFDVALPAYIGAAYTGFSRVRSDNHYPQDVLVGAVIGRLSSYIFTTKYNGIELKPIFGENIFGLGFSKRW